jgi:hypothetical protein
MATYRLAKNPAYIIASGHPEPRHFKAGEVIEVADDVPPAETWEPLDDAARLAVAKAQRPYTIAKNGVQALDRATGQARVTRHNEKIPRATPSKSPKPAAATRVPEPRHVTTAADYVSERQAIFEGKDPAGQDDSDLVASERLRLAMQRSARRGT